MVSLFPYLTTLYRGQQLLFQPHSRRCSPSPPTVPLEVLGYANVLAPPMSNGGPLNALLTSLAASVVLFAFPPRPAPSASVPRLPALFPPAPLSRLAVGARWRRRYSGRH